MVITNLTDDLIAAGERLLARLDESGFSPDVAFWRNFPEEQSWKLSLQAMQLAEEGPRVGYEKVQRVLSKYAKEFGALDLTDVVVERSSSPIAELIRKATRTSPSTLPLRLRNQAVNGTFIDDVLIYRARKRAKTP